MDNEEFESAKQAIIYAVESIIGAWNELGKYIRDLLPVILEDYEIEISKYIPKKKPILPEKNVINPSNILFDKRERIHRCRNNC